VEYTGKLDARSWMKIGKSTDTPKLGHVTVFWREKKVAWKGHVGLFAGYSLDKTKIFTLGGNQNNMLQVRGYPVEALDFGLLGFRELSYI
jgi:hypothetical protein